MRFLKQSFVYLSEFLVSLTERWLTYRLQRKRQGYLKRKKRGIIVDWLVDFLWVIGFVLLLNQYILQSYVIPSGSMIPNLLIGDYLFVERWSYGPQLFPDSYIKVPGLRTPHRGDIITFENPDFETKGIVHDLLQRFLFLFTLTLIDLDRDPVTKDPAVRLFVKRLVSEGNTFIKFEKGELFFQPIGLSQWFNEKDFNQKTGVFYQWQRLVNKEDYNIYPSIFWKNALADKGIFLSEYENLSSAFENTGHVDYFEMERLLGKYKSLISPFENARAKQQALQKEILYIPEGFVLPIGDNRDNSHDGRFFGVVEAQKLQGKALFRFFPFSRFGSLNG